MHSSTTQLEFKQSRTQAERLAATRRDILDVSVRLLWKEGYAKCSIANIARNSSFSTGAIQHHFSNKSSLICAVITERIFPSPSYDIPIDLASLSREQKCEKLIQEMWKYYGNPYYPVVWDIMLSTKQQSEIQSTVSSFFEDQTARTREALLKLFPNISLTNNQCEALVLFISNSLRGLAMSNSSNESASSNLQLELLSSAVVNLINNIGEPTK